jgi:hypothetical protein
MPTDLVSWPGLPLSSTYAAGAAVLMATLADQTTLTWPDEFPRIIGRLTSRKEVKHPAQSGNGLAVILTTEEERCLHVA